MVPLPRGESSQLEPGDTFTATSSDAVLVYGVTVRQADQAASGDVGGEVTWVVEKSDLSFPTMVSIGFPDDLQPNRRSLVAWRVPAGTWSVRQVNWHDDSQSGATPPQAGHAFGTTLAPGEVVYAGDIVIDPGRQPAAVSIDNDPAAARADLAAYTEVTVPLTDRPLADLRTGRESRKKAR